MLQQQQHQEVLLHPICQRKIQEYRPFVRLKKEKSRQIAAPTNWLFSDNFSLWCSAEIYVRFMSYSKCSNWHRISKLLLKFVVYLLFAILMGQINQIDLHICNLWISQSVI